MLRLSVFTVLVLAVMCVIAAVAAAVVPGSSRAFRVPLTHHAEHHESNQYKSTLKLLQIHRSLAIRGLQPQGARVGGKATAGGAPRLPMFFASMSGAYTATVTVGTPPQKFEGIVQDTGSSNFWIPDSTCNGNTYPECAVQKKYQNASSSTFQNQCSISSCFLFLPYGSGTVFGTISMDTLNYAGVDLPQTNFGRVYAEPGPTSEWGGSEFNGIVGLAFSIIAMPIGSNLPGPFEEMWRRKLLDANLFALYLSPITNSTNSFISFGAVPSGAPFVGKKTELVMPLAQDLFGYWMVNLDGMTVGGASVDVGSSAYAVLDSGTTLFAIGTQAAANAIIPRTNVSADCSNLHSLPTITVTLSGMLGEKAEYKMTPEMYTYKVDLKEGGSQCQNGFFYMDVGEGVANINIAGSVFLRNFPTVFNMDTRSVTIFNPTR